MASNSVHVKAGLQPLAFSMGLGIPSDVVEPLEPSLLALLLWIPLSLECPSLRSFPYVESPKMPSLQYRIYDKYPSLLTHCSGNDQRWRLSSHLQPTTDDHTGWGSVCTKASRQVWHSSWNRKRKKIAGGQTRKWIAIRTRQTWNRIAKPDQCSQQLT